MPTYVPTPFGDALQVIDIAGGSSGSTGVNIPDGADITQGSKSDQAWQSGDATVIALLKKIASAGGSAVSIADGADITQGATADAAITTDVGGTVSAKLRGLLKIYADLWDIQNHGIKCVVVTPLPASTYAIGALSTGTNQVGIVTQRVATSNPSAQAHGSLILPMADNIGRNVVTVGHVRQMVAATSVLVNGNAQTGIIGAGGAGVFHDLSSLTITTTFTSVATITVRSVSNGATAVAIRYPNANLAPGVPLVLSFQPPIPQDTANSQWTVTQSAATMAAIYSMVYIKNI